MWRPPEPPKPVVKKRAGTHGSRQMAVMREPTSEPSRWLMRGVLRIAGVVSTLAIIVFGLVMFLPWERFEQDTPENAVLTYFARHADKIGETQVAIIGMTGEFDRRDTLLVVKIPERSPYAMQIIMERARDIVSGKRDVPTAAIVSNGFILVRLKATIERRDISLRLRVEEDQWAVSQLSEAEFVSEEDTRRRLVFVPAHQWNERSDTDIWRRARLIVSYIRQSFH